MTAEAVFRREYGRCVATLIRFLGDIDAAEEAVQDAFNVAANRWLLDGPGALEGNTPHPGSGTETRNAWQLRAWPLRSGHGNFPDPGKFPAFPGSNPPGHVLLGAVRVAGEHVQAY